MNGFNEVSCINHPMLHDFQEAACGYGVLIMAVYWVTEAFPIAVTALLPIVIFPLLGVMDSGDIAMQYAKVRRHV